MNPAKKPAPAQGPHKGTAMKRRHITNEEQVEWAALAQVHMLGALMGARGWRAGELAFHGGTSLHLSWASPRFSEDLDFLLERSVSADLPMVMRKVRGQLQERLMVLDPYFNVEIKDKTSKLARMANFHIVVTHAGVLERVMVKAEFWQVDAEYLKQYPTEFRTPMRPGEIVTRTTALVPAATLTSAIADKITALAGRPYLKYRDLFDIWWITTQTRALPAAPGRVVAPEVIDQYLHNRTAYGQGGPEVDAFSHGIESLQRFATLDDAELVRLADKDLKPFLPAPYWRQMRDGGVAQIVAQVKAFAADVVLHLQERQGTHAPRERAAQAGPGPDAASADAASDDLGDDGEVDEPDVPFERPRG